MANHVRKINAEISPDCWGHIAGLNNPADLVSRGVLPSALLKNELWWRGPVEIRDPGWTHTKFSEYETHEEEKQNGIVVLCAQTGGFELPNVSNISKMKRIIAYCLLFASQCRMRTTNPHLTVHDLERAELAILKHVQQGEYTAEINALKIGKQISKGSHILRLSPILDNRGLMRVGGRLENAEISFNARHQIILPSKHFVAHLIILEGHLRCTHGGPRLTEAV